MGVQKREDSARFARQSAVSSGFPTIPAKMGVQNAGMLFLCFHLMYSFKRTGVWALIAQSQCHWPRSIEIENGKIVDGGLKKEGSGWRMEEAGWRKEDGEEPKHTTSCQRHGGGYLIFGESLGLYLIV